MPQAASETSNDVAGLCLSELAALATAADPPRANLVPRTIDVLPDHPRRRVWHLGRKKKT